VTELELEFEERPSVAAYMLRALYPGGLRKAPPFPALCARWRGTRPDPSRLAQFLRLTGLGVKRGLPILYPQVFTFPLQMVILTHPASPLPIWKVLQIRNHLLQHRAIPADAALDAEAAVTGQRILERGLELDLHVGVRADGGLAWEGLTTYYYRGRFGAPGPSSPLAEAPAGARTEVARWRTDRGGGLRFSGLSGDYNGIHYWGAYARLFGFRGAFHHPHALSGQCLARMAEPRAAAQRLDLWLKGPVYYGSEVGLAAGGAEGGVAFALTARDGSRPALQGRWIAAEAGSRLLGAGGGSAA
jgi:hypothetical protein